MNAEHLYKGSHHQHITTEAQAGLGPDLRTRLPVPSLNPAQRSPSKPRWRHTLMERHTSRCCFHTAHSLWFIQDPHNKRLILRMSPDSTSMHFLGSTGLRGVMRESASSTKTAEYHRKVEQIIRQTDWGESAASNQCSDMRLKQQQLDT